MTEWISLLIIILLAYGLGFGACWLMEREHDKRKAKADKQ